MTGGAPATPTTADPRVRPVPTAAARHCAWAVPALVAAGVTAWRYDAKPLWRDEVFTLATAGRPLPDLWRALAENDAGLTVYYHLVHLWIAVAGDSSAALRLPGALAAVGLAAVTGLLGRRLGGTAAGIAAGVLVSLMPVVVQHTQEARPYPVLLLAVVTAAHALVLDRGAPARRWLVLWCVAATAGASLHVLTGGPAVVVLLAAAFCRPGRRTRRVIAAGAVLPVLGALGSAAAGVVQAGPRRTVPFAGVVELVRLRHNVGGSSVAVVLLVVLAAVGVVWLVRGGRTGPAVVVLAWIAVPTAVLLVNGAVGGYFQPRYLAATAPACALLAGAGVGALGQVARRRGSPALFAVPAAAVVLVVVAQSPSVRAAREAPFYGDQPDRAATALAQRAGRDAVVFVGGASRPMIERYLPAGTEVDDVLLLAPAPAGTAVGGRELPAGERAAALGDRDRVWLVGTRAGDGWSGGSEASVAAAERGRRLVSAQDFGRTRLELWTRR